MIHSFLNTLLIWFPAIISGAILIIAAYYYLKGEINSRLINKLVISTIILFALNAIVNTVVRYFVWEKNPLGKLLLPPHQSIKYFINYSLAHFWLAFFVSLIAAFSFYLFLKLLHKHKERFFMEGEVKLGFLMALVIGWPNIIIFIPLAFALTILVAIFKQIFLKESYTTLGLPFLLSALISIIFSNYFETIFHLGVLSIKG